MLYTLQFHSPDGAPDVVERLEAASDDAARAYAMECSARMFRTVKVSGEALLGAALMTANGPIWLDGDRIQDAPAMRDLLRWDGLPLPLVPL